MHSEGIEPCQLMSVELASRVPMEVAQVNAALLMHWNPSLGDGQMISESHTYLVSRRRLAELCGHSLHACWDGCECHASRALSPSVKTKVGCWSCSSHTTAWKCMTWLKAVNFTKIWLQLDFTKLCQVVWFPFLLHDWSSTFRWLWVD